MGIDISGALLVGCYGSNIDIEALQAYTIEHQGDCDEYDVDDCPSDWSSGELFEYWEFTVAAGHYDGGIDCSYVGFEVTQYNILNDWPTLTEDLQDKAKKFKSITGLDAKLIGCQNVY